MPFQVADRLRCACLQCFCWLVWRRQGLPLLQSPASCVSMVRRQQVNNHETLLHPLAGAQVLAVPDQLPPCLQPRDD